MKSFLCLTSAAFLVLNAGCVASSPASAQTPVPIAVAPPGPPPSTPAVAAVAPLDQLVAPVALYPDALLALVLTASTSSSDVVLAARYLNGGGDRNQVEAQPWDDSVKGLAHYPDVVKWMDENLAWTQRLGDAYLSSPDDVMAAVQRVRAQARANGVLADTPQQQVIVDGSYIRIIPAQADVIYVPRYDPEVIYIERPAYYYPDPWITFGMGFGVGWWLHYDCDWGHRVVVVDPHRRDRWHAQRDWRRPDYPGRDWHPWRPTPGRPRPPHRDFDRDRPHDGIARPTPLPGAPRLEPDRWRNRERRPDRDGGPGFDRRPERPAALPPRAEGGGNQAALPPGSRRLTPWSPGAANARPAREAVATPPKVQASPPNAPQRNDSSPHRRPLPAGEQVRLAPGARIDRPVGPVPAHPVPAAPPVAREFRPAPRPQPTAPAQRVTAPPPRPAAPPASVHTAPPPARSQPPPVQRDSSDNGGRHLHEPDR